MSDVEPISQSEVPVDHDLIRSLAESWPRRATVRGSRYTFTGTEYTDPERPDYPKDLVPFWKHPTFEAAPQEKKNQVLTWGWIAYNLRTVHLEERLANPAFALIMHDAFPGAKDIELRKAVQQALLDEIFHTYMHMVAIDDTRRFRGLDDFEGPLARPARRLEECRAAVSDESHRAHISLAFGVVAELSVKAFLDLMSNDTTIQPAHASIARLHNKDEAAHGRLLGEVAKQLWTHMSPTHREWFVAAMPDALDAFAAQDFSTWRAILHHVGVEGADGIVSDVESVTNLRNVVTKVSEVRKVLDQLGVLDRVAEQPRMEFLRAS